MESNNQELKQAEVNVTGCACADAICAYFKKRDNVNKLRRDLKFAEADIVEWKQHVEETKARFYEVQGILNDFKSSAAAAKAASEAAEKAELDDIIKRHQANFDIALDGENVVKKEYEVEKLFRVLGPGNEMPTKAMYKDFFEASLETKRIILVWYKTEGVDYSLKANALASVNYMDVDGHVTHVENPVSNDAPFEVKEASRKQSNLNYMKALGPGNAHKEYRDRKRMRLLKSSADQGAGCHHQYGKYFQEEAPKEVIEYYQGDDGWGSDYEVHEVTNMSEEEEGEPSQGGAPSLKYWYIVPDIFEDHVEHEILLVDGIHIRLHDVLVKDDEKIDQSSEKHVVFSQKEDGWCLEAKGGWEEDFLKVDGVPVTTTDAISLTSGSSIDFVFPTYVASYKFNGYEF